MINIISDWNFIIFAEDNDPLKGYFTQSNTEEAVVPSEKPIIIANRGNCVSSVTTVNGRPACKGKVVFNELFDSPLSDTIWKYIIQMSDAPVSL